ncbi:MAG: FG-GAP-like repeat-containing protein [Candidatus Sulfotelmatobacter sp.]
MALGDNLSMGELLRRCGLVRQGSFFRIPLFGLLWALGLCRPLLAQFETRTDVPAIASPLALAVGDFNHDGKLDFADATNNLQIFLGNGDGTFQNPVNYLVGTGALFVAAADLNNDDKIDLAVADLNGLYVLIGNGDGTFQAPVLYTTACIPTFVAVDDFNGDHKPDLLVTYSSGNCLYVSVFAGNGDGTFQPSPINTVTAYSPAGTAIGDFNGDGKRDIAIGEQFGTLSQVGIMLGNGNGTFSEGETYPVGSFPTAATTADFRGNGKLDLAIATLYGGTTLLLGNGDGTFTQGGSLATVDADWVLSADFNGDGKTDLAVASQEIPIAGVYVALGNGDGTFQTPAFYLAGTNDRFAAAGDFNGDHRTDLAIPDYRYGGVVVLLNTGEASFSPKTAINFPFQLVGAASPEQTVTLTNTGTAALSVSSFKVTGPFQQSNNCGKKVAAGAKCKIEITFKPQNTNNVTGTVTISDSASSKPQVIELTGAGTLVKLSPLKLAFGNEKVGTKSAPQTVTVSNQGSTALSLTQVYVGGTNYQDFLQSNNCPTSLNAGASCTVTVAFDPIKTGTRSAVLGFTDNGGGSPQTVPLNGTGD